MRNNPFLKYFLRYLVNMRSGKGLLVFAFLGIFISAFALLVLQSVMQGLQHNLIKRSQNVVGTAVVVMNHDADQSKEKLLQILKILQSFNLKKAYPEYEMEMLVQNGKTYVPLSIHGIDLSFGKAQFLFDTDVNHLAVGIDVLSLLKNPLYTRVNLISPTFVDSILGVVTPRTVSEVVNEVVSTSVPEVDIFYAWTRIGNLQQLMHKVAFNRIRLYDNLSEEKRVALENEIQKMISPRVQILSWEKQNDALVLALRLENIMVVSLFVLMSILVGVSIHAGLMVFFNKVRKDILAFWIMGISLNEIKRGMKSFVLLMSTLSVLSGLGMASLLLLFLDYFAPSIMPAVFVEQKIPVHFSFNAYILASVIPLLVSWVFARNALNQLKPTPDNLMELLRSKI